MTPRPNRGRRDWWPKWVNYWSAWPQELAPNVVNSMVSKRHLSRRHGYLERIHEAAQLLSVRFNPPLPLEAIVVFYPRRMAKSVYATLTRIKRENPGRFEHYRGLTISSTNKLTRNCMAFRIEDVENHKTPADAYHIDIHRGHKRLNINPAPVYSEDENDGTAVHD